MKAIEGLSLDELAALYDGGERIARIAQVGESGHLHPVFPSIGKNKERGFSQPIERQRWHAGDKSVNKSKSKTEP